MPNLKQLNRVVPPEIAAQAGPSACEPLTVTIPETIRISGYSRSEVYRRLASGDLEAVKAGRSTRVLMQSIRRSVAALPRARFKSPAP